MCECMANLNSFLLKMLPLDLILTSCLALVITDLHISLVWYYQMGSVHIEYISDLLVPLFSRAVSALKHLCYTALIYTTNHHIDYKAL